MLGRRSGSVSLFVNVRVIFLLIGSITGIVLVLIGAVIILNLAIRAVPVRILLFVFFINARDE